MVLNGIEWYELYKIFVYYNRQYCSRFTYDRTILFIINIFLKNNKTLLLFQQQLEMRDILNYKLFILVTKIITIFISNSFE